MITDAAVSLVKVLVFVVLSSDAASELHVLGHQSNSFGMESTEVTVFKEASEVTFRGLLKCFQPLRREPYFRLLLASDFFNQSLEWKPRYDGLDLILKPFNLSECDRSGSETLILLQWLLHCRQGGCVLSTAHIRDLSLSARWLKVLILHRSLRASR